MNKKSNQETDTARKARLLFASMPGMFNNPFTSNKR